MAARRYWPATRAERERPMESLYRLRADIGFCEPRLRGLEKRGGRRPLLFRKVGGREPGFRTALCYSADSLTCASGFLEFLRPCTFAFALPSSRQTLSFPKSTIIPSHFSSNLSIFLLVAHAVLSLKIYTYVKRANESSIHLSRINVADVEYLDTNFF